jgi:type II secretory pathway predicted ATPase ExeA
MVKICWVTYLNRKAMALLLPKSLNCQRFSKLVQVRLKSFSEENTKEYIIHRLHIAGAPRNPFTEDAMRAIYRYSNGVPRLINTICDNALLDGFLFKTTTIDEAIIRAVTVDLGLSEE